MTSTTDWSQAEWRAVDFTDDIDPYGDHLEYLNPPVEDTGREGTLCPECIGKMDLDDDVLCLGHRTKEFWWLNGPHFSESGDVNYLSREDAFLMAAAPPMYVTLKEFEWLEPSFHAFTRCAICSNAKIDGHSPTCSLARLLRAVETGEWS